MWNEMAVVVIIFLAYFFRARDIYWKLAWLAHFLVRASIMKRSGDDDIITTLRICISFASRNQGEFSE